MSPLLPFQRVANTLEAGRVARYHAVPTVAPQSVGQHSWGVAVLCIYVTGGDPSMALLKQALMHDAAEIFSGDAPFTVKRHYPEVKAMYRQLEVVAHQNVVMPEFELDEHDAAVLKLCDTVEGLIWCRKTELTGSVRTRWLDALNQGLAKFADVISEEEHARIVTLVNNENFHPTL